MTRPVHTLLQYFKHNRYKPVSLDFLVSKSGKSRGTVLRYLSEVRRRCPRGWRLRREITVDDLGIRWTWYRYCPTVESFRKQQEIFQEKRTA